jgi:hypothetical protein
MLTSFIDDTGQPHRIDTAKGGSTYRSVPADRVGGGITPYAIAGATLRRRAGASYCQRSYSSTVGAASSRGT